MADKFSPIDKSKVNEVAFGMLDLINEHYGEGAEIQDVVLIARVKDSGGEGYTDYVPSSGMTKGKLLDMLAFVHELIRTDHDLRDQG